MAGAIHTGEERAAGVYKILNDNEIIDKAKFFKPAFDSHRLLRSQSETVQAKMC